MLKIHPRLIYTDHLISFKMADVLRLIYDGAAWSILSACITCGRIKVGKQKPPDEDL
jgi:hypothetical protein